MAYVACNGKSVPQPFPAIPGGCGGSRADQIPGIGVRCRVSAVKRIDDPSDFWMFQLVVEVARLDVSQEILKK